MNEPIYPITDSSIRKKMLLVSDSILARVTNSYGMFFQHLSGIPARKCATDVLTEEKVRDQIALFCKSFGLQPQNLHGKRLLEVGSGFGIFVAVTRRDYGVESYGLEPAASGFDSSYDISRQIMAEYGIDPSVIINACGEDITFPDSHFDFIFSSTTLEHTERPERVLDEAIRVLKPGGCLQFVFPNYGSVFEGHYAIPWIPYLPRSLARLWLRLWGRDPSFLDTLQFTNYFRTRRWLRKRNDVELVTLGEEVFAERMRKGIVKDWGGLGHLQRWLNLAQKLRLVSLAIWLCLHIKAFDPIILTLRKKPIVPVAIKPDNQVIYDLNWSDWIDMKRYGPSSRWLRSLITDLIQAHLWDRRIRTILDFGCGEGSTTNCLAQKFPNALVLGVDQSRSGIECGKVNYARPNLTFSCQDAAADLGESAYDLVTCFEVLEHVDDWRGLAARLAKASRRYLMVSFPTGRMRKFEVNVGHLRNFAPGEFESFAASLGLRTVQVFYAGFPCYSPIFRNLCDLTNSGHSSMTRGSYSFATRRLSDLIFFIFRFLSTRNRFGDQFCGLFEWNTDAVDD